MSFMIQSSYYNMSRLSDIHIYKASESDCTPIKYL